MGNTTLMEDFRKLGLTEEESTPLAKMLGESVQDAEEDSDALDIINHYKTEGIKLKKEIKKTGMARMKAVHARKKAGAKRSARKSARKLARKAKTGAWQAGKKKIAAKRAPKSHGRVIIKRVLTGLGRKGPQRSWREYDAPTMSEALIDNLQVLAESLDVDPSDRFEKYVEAFNHIADLGELLTLRYHEMEAPLLATEMAEIATAAESVLESMEEIDGAVDPETDAALEEILSDAMEDVNGALEIYGDVISEQDEEDEEDDEEECECDPDDEECTCDEEDVEEDVDDDDDDEVNEDRLSMMIEAAKKAAKKIASYPIGKKTRFKAKKGKGGKLSAYEKELSKTHKGVKDPDALAGWIDKHHGWDRKKNKPRIK